MPHRLRQPPVASAGVNPRRRPWPKPVPRRGFRPAGETTGATGLEPATPGFGDRCATNCATPLGCAEDCIRARVGITGRVSTIEEERPNDDDGDLLEEQEGQGYGDDEGERDDALEAEDS